VEGLPFTAPHQTAQQGAVDAELPALRDGENAVLALGEGVHAGEEPVRVVHGHTVAEEGLATCGGCG
jgi:hypothetical protein